MRMSIETGTRTLGPHNGELLVHTGRRGGAAKAGHDLVIEVTAWNATLNLREDPSLSSIALSADGGSLRVRDGSGGIMALGEDDKDGIRQTIDEEVLRGGSIEFRSTAVAAEGDRRHLRVLGELELNGRTAPIQFELLLSDDGRLSGAATIRQSDWGIRPYTTLFGALKVADEVRVTVEADLAG
jgi:polyisoprenoid-binding protein YceI